MPPVLSTSVLTSSFKGLISSSRPSKDLDFVFTLDSDCGTDDDQSFDMALCAASDFSFLGPLPTFPSMCDSLAQPDPSSHCPENASNGSQLLSDHSRPRGNRATPVTPTKTRRGNAIPRPPNAFMLFRSDLLKNNKIPLDVERRQQNLSRVAGECWNMLPQEAREEWFQKARDALEAHKVQYPDYKFTPRKSPSKSRGSVGSADEEDKNHIRSLRERWVGMIGPAVPPGRARRSRARKAHREVDDSAELATRSRSASNAPSPASSSSSMPSPAGASSQIPASTYDLHFPTAEPDSRRGRPGRPVPRGLTLDGLLLTEHARLFDNDPTPRAAIFGNISIPGHLSTSSNVLSSDSQLWPAPQLEDTASSSTQTSLSLEMMSWSDFSSNVPTGSNFTFDMTNFNTGAFEQFGSFDPNSFALETGLPASYMIGPPDQDPGQDLFTFPTWTDC